MTAKASDLVARMAASAAGSRREAEILQTHAELVGHQPNGPSSTIVKFMVKMPKAQHRFIRQFALDSDSDASTIVRTLLSRIETDPVFAEELRTLLRDSH